MPHLSWFLEFQPEALAQNKYTDPHPEYKEKCVNARRKINLVNHVLD